MDFTLDAGMEKESLAVYLPDLSGYLSRYIWNMKL